MSRLHDDLPGQGQLFDDVDDDDRDVLGRAAIRGEFLPHERARARRKRPPKPRKCRLCGRTGGNDWAASDLCNGCKAAAKGGATC